MRTINAIEEARQYCKEAKAQGKTIATINTSGHLHHGHMSLVKLAKEKADITIMMAEFPVEFMTWKKSRFEKLEKKYLDDIMDKERTLRHMMKPNTWDEITNMLVGAGFSSIQPFWRNHAFVGAIAIK